MVTHCWGTFSAFGRVPGWIEKNKSRQRIGNVFGVIAIWGWNLAISLGAPLGVTLRWRMNNFTCWFFRFVFMCFFVIFTYITTSFYQWLFSLFHRYTFHISASLELSAELVRVCSARLATSLPQCWLSPASCSWPCQSASLEPRLDDLLCESTMAPFSPHGKW